MTKPRYMSTKTFTHSAGLSTAFRQWRAESHCRFIHGYALQIHIKFIERRGLDNRNWVIDFGGLKTFKRELENLFDHKTMVAIDDPHLDDFRKLEELGLMDITVVTACGCEAFAYLVYTLAQRWLGDNNHSDVEVYEVEVREHESNSAIARNPNYV